MIKNDAGIGVLGSVASPNLQLVGKSSGRRKLDTPALILDLDALERNIARMAEYARSHGVSVRPHVKAHKSSRIAELQREAGACGFCCATVGEAEMMVAAGFSNILITSPIVSDEKIGRALALALADSGLCLVVDNPANAVRLSQLATAAGRPVDVLVDVDAGMQRTGAATQRAAIELARRVHSLEGLNYRGLQCYAGHVQHIADREAQQEAALSVLGALRVLCEELKVHGLAPQVISGGGTGSHAIDGSAGVLTELQVGSYALMDNQYNEVWLSTEGTPPFETALFVQSAVISNNHPGHVTCDAGLKHFGVDGGSPVIASGVAAGARYDYFGDVHGRVGLPDPQGRLALGSRIEFVVPHCDPTVNLYNAYHCVRGDELVAIWPVDARGV